MRFASCDPVVILAQQSDPAYMAQRARQIMETLTGKVWCYSADSGEWTLEPVYDGSIKGGGVSVDGAFELADSLDAPPRRVVPDGISVRPDLYSLWTQHEIAMCSLRRKFNVVATRPTVTE